MSFALPYEEIRTESDLFLEPKHFYRKIEQIFEELGTAGPSEAWATNFLSRFHSLLAGPLGIETIHLYRRHSRGGELICATHNGKDDLAPQMLNRLAENRDLDLPWTGPLGKRLASIIPFGANHNLLLGFFTN